MTRLVIPANDNSRWPLAEEHRAGRVSARQMRGAQYLIRTGQGEEQRHWRTAGVSMNIGGSKRAYVSRDPGALFGQEIEADRTLKLGRVQTLLGGLFNIVWRAVADRAEMRDLAPSWPLQSRFRAAAGRERVCAGLDILAHLDDAEAYEQLHGRPHPARITKIDALRIINAAAERVEAYRLKRAA